MKRCLAVLLSVLLLMTSVLPVSADMIYNDDQLNWDGMYDPDAPCTHRTRTRYEAVESTCAIHGHGAYAVCNDCDLVLEGSDRVLPLTEHTYDDDYDADCNVCGGTREVGEIPADYNLIKNGSFEKEDLSCWDFAQEGYALLNRYAHEGEYALKFDCAVSQDGICVQPHTDYLLTFWATRTDGMTVKMMAGDRALIQMDTGSVGEWTQFGGVFNSGDQTELYFLLNGFGFIDDIVLIQAVACPHVYDNVCDTVCNWCNAVREVAPHAYDTFVERDATCGSEGAVRYVCTVCGDAYTAVIPATGAHQYEGYPCCEQQCVGCGAVIPAPSDHEYEVAGNGDATCGEEGWIDYRCVYCGDFYSVTVPATGEHTYDYDCDEYCNECGDWREITGHNYQPGREIAPGCVTEGMREYVCSDCHSFYVETLPPTGEHTYDNDCDADCNGCGQWREVGEHVYELIRDTAPSCTVDGLREYVCIHCGASYIEVIPAVGHVYDDIYDAECNTCGFIRDAACKHEYTAVVTAPTCTAEGYTTHTCIKCGDSYVDGTVSPTNHEGTTVTTPATDATCTENGVTESVYCTACGVVFKEGEFIPALGHTQVLVPGYAPTCTENGVTESVYCTACGVVFKEGEFIPALGHMQVLVPGYAPTCTVPGLTESVKCSVCGDTLVAGAVIPALGHTETLIPGYPATCIAAGLTDGYACSVCGDVTVAGAVIPALGHTVAVTEGIAPTCTADGLTAGSYCSACDHVFVAQTIIPALGHTEAIIVSKDATCVDTGLTEGVKCSACGVVLVAQVTIPATGHVFDDDYDPDCNVCGYQRDVAILGDADGDGRVNNRDLGVLQKYLNEWSVSVDLRAVDLNDDGKVNNRDLGLLQRLLNQ